VFQAYYYDKGESGMVEEKLRLGILETDRVPRGSKGLLEKSGLKSREILSMRGGGRKNSEAARRIEMRKKGGSAPEKSACLKVKSQGTKSRNQQRPNTSVLARSINLWNLGMKRLVGRKGRMAAQISKPHLKRVQRGLVGNAVKGQGVFVKTLARIRGDIGPTYAEWVAEGGDVR